MKSCRQLFQKANKIYSFFRFTHATYLWQLNPPLDFNWFPSPRALLPQRHNKYLTNFVFPVRTVSERTLFCLLIYGPRASHLGHRYINDGKKTSNLVSKSYVMIIAMVIRHDLVKTIISLVGVTISTFDQQRQKVSISHLALDHQFTVLS